MLSRFGISSARKMSSKAGVVAPLSNRVYLLNWFEKPPMNDKEYHAFWEETALYVAKQDHFISTHLHRALGEKSKFTWCNLAVFDSADVCLFGKPDPEWERRMVQHSSMDLKAYPGQYNEIGSYNGNKLDDADKTRPEDARFLLTAVTADDSVSSEDLEGSWASVMKTDFIHDKLGPNPALKDSLLYKMIAARLPLVRYAVRTELSGIDDQQGIELAEMVDAQQNAKGVKTHTGCFKVRTNMYYKA